MAEAEAPEQATPSRKSRLWLWILLAVLLLGAAGGGAWLLLGKAAPAQAAGAEAEAPRPAHYLALDPEFIVNFEQPQGPRYLQVALQVMARDEGVLDALRAHMPVIRNNILLLLSGQTHEQVRTREGKEQLRAALVRTINKVLADEGGDDPGQVESVYFTSFVMQ